MKATKEMIKFALNERIKNVKDAAKQCKVILGNTADAEKMVEEMKPLIAEMEELLKEYKEAEK